MRLGMEAIVGYLDHLLPDYPEHKNPIVFPKPGR
jgi:hypothetical protein